MSTYHLKLKFPKEVGVREARREQVLTQECYVQELISRGKDVLMAENWSCNEMPHHYQCLLIVGGGGGIKDQSNNGYDATLEHK